jgi:pyruvate formate lyase activating enzyme
MIRINRDLSDATLTGTVLEIQRMSTEDGPGLRTTVFFKGCSLRCSWCHNPESLELKPEIQWIESRCILCKTCMKACTRGVLSFIDACLVIDRAWCAGCGSCAGECPAAALEILGRTWNVERLVHEVVKDVPYFGNTGGVTASGGEAALQAHFVAAFFKELMGRGIRTALDTCGQCPQGYLDEILPHTDLLLYDIKEIDPGKHREFTGSSNELILKNVVHAAEYTAGHTLPREIWIRTPLIPGATDRKDNISGIGGFIAKHLHGTVNRWELCAFNNLCSDKYRRLGKEWAFSSSRLLDREAIEDLAQTARSSGVDPAIVCWSGSTGPSIDDSRTHETALAGG